MEVEKEKRKGRPRRGRILFLLLTLILMPLCGSFLYYVIPGHAMSDFHRFKRAEEVVAFLHEPFDLQVTTSEEILAFMEAYPLRSGSCEVRPIVHENVAEIIECSVPTWLGFGSEIGYRIEFWMTKDNLLEYIEAERYCICI